MTEVDEIIKETHESFFDMRRIPNSAWAQFKPVTFHPLIRCKFMARNCGIELRERKLNGVEAIAHFKQKLRRENARSEHRRIRKAREDEVEATRRTF